MDQLKDDILFGLSRTMNVAQFLSVRADAPNVPRHVCIRNFTGDGASLQDTVGYLLSASVDAKVNVRTFSEVSSKGGEFLMGLSEPADVLAAIGKFTRAGTSVIINESIDIHDGGVSGVVFGNTVEFAPDDTPRCVEKPGVCRLPREIGFAILNYVYNVSLRNSFAKNFRVEFSIHPRRRGVQHSQFIIWEAEQQSYCDTSEIIQASWPNRFSEHIGDKTFGLLVAHALGQNVPFTTAISRRVRPFVFGRPTETNEFWYRTSPRRQMPGKLPTVLGHQDLFAFLDNVAPDDRDALASVLVQEGVEATFSGGAAISKSGASIIEGVRGRGDAFMLGKASPAVLPTKVQSDVEAALLQLGEALGPCRMEWVHDGTTVWVVQVHVGGISSDPVRIVDGNADEWIDFDVNDGLEKLRTQLSKSDISGKGIRLIGDVGVTSHFGDLLRGKGIPSFICKTNN